VILRLELLGSRKPAKRLSDERAVLGARKDRIAALCNRPSNDVMRSSEGD